MDNLLRDGQEERALVPHYLLKDIRVTVVHVTEVRLERVEMEV